jgi:capsid portal protein
MAGNEANYGGSDSTGDGDVSKSEVVFTNNPKFSISQAAQDDVNYGGGKAQDRLTGDTGWKMAPITDGSDDNYNRNEAATDRSTQDDPDTIVTDRRSERR